MVFCSEGINLMGNVIKFPSRRSVQQRKRVFIDTPEFIKINVPRHEVNVNAGDLLEGIINNKIIIYRVNSIDWLPNNTYSIILEKVKQ